MVQRRRSPAPWLFAVSILAIALSSLGGAVPAVAQQQAATLPHLNEYDWTRWLVGEWDGWIEDAEGNRTRQRQSFEYIVDGRYILTRLKLGEDGGPMYHGIGMFRYDPVKGQSWAEWFGMFGDRNYGLGRRDGERWVWDIHRHGRLRVLRVRERLSEDEYIVTSTTITEEGTERVSKEHLRRVKNSTDSQSGNR